MGTADAPALTVLVASGVLLLPHILTSHMALELRVTMLVTVEAEG